MKYSYNKYGINKYASIEAKLTAFSKLEHNRYVFFETHPGVSDMNKDKSGFNIYCYDKNGYDKYGYDTKGYNKEGYNRHGYDKHGLDKEGYDVYGFNLKGYNKEGAHRESFRNKSI